MIRSKGQGTLEEAAAAASAAACLAACKLRRHIMFVSFIMSMQTAAFYINYVMIGEFTVLKIQL